MKGILLFVAMFTAALGTAQTGPHAPTSNRQNRFATEQDKQNITNGPVAEYVADSSATIGWSTQHAGSVNIRYGIDRDHLDRTAAATQSSDERNHHVRLEGLTPDTRYYFQAMQNGEPIGAVGTFRTVTSGAAPVKSKAIIPQ